MAISPLLARLLAARTARPYQQFGQASDAYTANGATGCTHTCAQFVAELYTGRWWTHDEISRKIGYPNMSVTSPRRGMTSTELVAFFRAAGLPYVMRTGWTPAQMLAAARLGPVFVSHLYPWWPEWRGYVYRGVTADGKPNGYATPSGKAGRTQLSGFSGGHAGLLLGAAGTLVYAWEPNHGSTARPEKPAYDVMSVAQFAAVATSYQYIPRTSFCYVPTRPPA